MEVYDLWYTFREDGMLKKTRGFVYKERKNDDEVRKINDWMEENRKYDYQKGVFKVKKQIVTFLLSLV